MKCDIIIPVWNQLASTRRCIENIRKNTRYPYCLIIIDNNSDRKTKDYLKSAIRPGQGEMLITNDENLGFIKAANQGLEASSSPYVLLMNNDTVPTHGWLDRMVRVAESDPRIGLVNPRSEPPGRVSLEEYSWKLSLNRGQYVETNQCMGFCMLIKREVIQKCGYLDEAYGVGGFDDTDFSRKADLSGYKCVCAKDAYVYHEWHTSFKKAGNREDIVRLNEAIYFNKWGRHLRLGYPIVYDTSRDLYLDANTSLGLAREWHWVHAWLNSTSLLENDPHYVNLPEHQNLRLFNMSGIRLIFYLQVLFRLFERSIKKKKLYDAILVSDKKLYKVLSFFKAFISSPIVYIGKEGHGADDSEEAWRRRARGIAEFIKKGARL